MSDPRAGGSLWLDSLLYDEVLATGLDSDGLCDLIHEEFLRSDFAALNGAELEERQPLSTCAMSSADSSPVPVAPHCSQIPSR
jgi:hypothetical protein